jgi:hypothetical protein
LSSSGQLALVVIATAQLMVILDATIVNVALPNIEKALGFSGTGLEWVVNAYALTFGGLLLGGRAGDIAEMSLDRASGRATCGGTPGPADRTGPCHICWVRCVCLYDGKQQGNGPMGKEDYPVDPFGASGERIEVGDAEIQDRECGMRILF